MSFRLRSRATLPVIGSGAGTGGDKTTESVYQDDLLTPGISPRSANERKQRRQTPNLRRYARGRPQILHRLCCRVENLGFLFALAIEDVFAIVSFFPCGAPWRPQICWFRDYAWRNGIPSSLSSERAWSSLCAVVTIVTFMPFIFSIFE